MGFQCLSESSVARLIYAIGFMDHPTAPVRGQRQPRHSKRRSTRGTDVIGDSVPIREKQNRRSRELRKHFSNQFFHNGREQKLNPLAEKRVDWTESLEQVGQNVR